MKRPTFGETLQCVWRTRETNEFTTVKKCEYFFAKEISEMSRNLDIRGTIGNTAVGLTIYSTNCPYPIKVGDTIDVNGDSYTVQGIGINKRALGLANSGRFSRDYVEKEAPKTIQLM